MKYYIVMFKTPDGSPQYLAGNGTGDRSFYLFDSEWFYTSLAALHIGRKEKRGEEESVIVLELSLTPLSVAECGHEI